MLKITLVTCLALSSAAVAPRDLQTQVCVVGGGSGGMSAALAAARAGAEVVVVECLDRLGGTSTMAYVSGWEPGPGDSFAREIYGRLHRMGAAGVSAQSNPQRKLGPFSLWQIVPELPYEESLYRAGTPYFECHGVLFDPEKLSSLVAELLQQTGRCRVMYHTRFAAVEMAGPRVVAIRAEAADGTAYRIRARVFIDATGDVELCRAAGCEVMLGEDSQSRFQEPSAPEKPQVVLNGISLCYRLRKADRPTPPREPSSPVPKLRRSAHITKLPCGDLIVNPLAIMPGTALVEQGREKVYAACRPIVEAHWCWLHQYAPFSQYEFHSLAPMLGVRESYRVGGDYVLSEHDWPTIRWTYTPVDAAASASNWADRTESLIAACSPAAKKT
jgi:NAD(P)-dependent dehydrogenase (short-subunit alcohol dehydrogenase family)